MRVAIPDRRPRTGGRLRLVQSEPAGGGRRPSRRHRRQAASFDHRAGRSRSRAAGLRRRRVHELGGERIAYATVVERETVAYESLEAGRSPRSACSARTGMRSSASAVSCSVRTARSSGTRPAAGAAERHRGYVPADDVRLVRVTTRITVDLSSGRSSSTGRASRSSGAPVAIGTPETPTPTGRYYVNQRLDCVRSHGAVGSRRGRHLGVLPRSAGLDSGRAHRNPRNQRPFVDRACGVARLRPARERRAAPCVRYG
jgi:hypothetical protein